MGPCQFPATVALTALLCLPAGCYATTSGGTGDPTHASATTAQVQRIVGKEYRFTTPGEKTSDYFILQPDGTLTWFAYVGDRYAPDSHGNWTSDGSQVTLNLPNVDPMTATVNGDNLINGKGVTGNGTKFTWQATPGERPYPAP